MLIGLQVGAATSLVIEWTLATTALILRLAARRMTRMPLWLDDFTCFTAYIFGSTYNAWVLVWVRDGFGLRLDEITWLSRAEVISRGRRDLFFCEFFNSLSIGTSKLAILALYWRLFSHTQIRYAIMYLGFLSFCWLVARAIIAIIRCIPTVAYWSATTDGECFIDQRKVIYGGTISHLILDSLILILPLFELRKLRLKFWPKLGVIAMFMSGILICVCATAVTVLVSRIQTGVELSFDIRNPVLISNVEVNLSIVTSCLPLLRPVFESLRRHLQLSSSSPAPSSSSCALPPDPHHQPPRHRFHCPTSVPTTLFRSTNLWSRLSSAVTSNANTGLGARTAAASAKSKTVMTVMHDEEGRGVHVHLRRDFRFISSPGPQPVLVRPRRTESSMEQRTVGLEVSTEDEALTMDEGNVINRMERGEGDVIGIVGDVIVPEVDDITTVRTDAAGQFEEGEAVGNYTDRNQPEIVDVAGNGKKIMAESEDEPKGASATPIVKNKEETPGQVGIDTQGGEAIYPSPCVAEVEDRG